MNHTAFSARWLLGLAVVGLLTLSGGRSEAAYLTTTVAGEVIVTVEGGSTAATSSFGVGCRGSEQQLFTGVPQNPVPTTPVSLGVKPAGTGLDFWLRTDFLGTINEAFSCELGGTSVPDSSRVAFLNAGGTPSVETLGVNDWRFRWDDAASFRVDNDDNDIVIRVTVNPSPVNTNITIVATNFCGPMDVVLVVDDTGSMGGAIDNVRQGLANIIATADAASGGDVRYGLVSFGVGIQVDQPLTCNLADITAAVNALAASGGNGEPEDSDTALQYVISGAVESGCVVSQPLGPLGTFRPNALKIAVLITDARPAGCDDQYDDGVDDVHAEAVASLAASNGVLISAILVDDGTRFITGSHPNGVEQEVMEKYATISGGFSTVVPANGDGTGNSIATIIANCGGGQTAASSCVTRPARFWFTHPSSDDPSCVTLKKALEACGGVSLGFINLPVEHRTPDFVKDAEDALIEALGLYWRSLKKTGEDRGLQNLGSPGSKLCQGRKSLGIELIAALGNSQVLGAVPEQCTYDNGGVLTNFPADLLRQARLTASGDDLEAIVVMTALLRKFNANGQTNNFPTGLVECSGSDRKSLRDMGRDPTTQQSCPGINDHCDSAQPVVFRKPTDIFSKAVYTGKASLPKYSDTFPFSPSCSSGGADAVWKISPTIALPGRAFTVTATGNMPPLVSVWSAESGNCSNLVEVICGTGSPGINSAEAKFRTDGTNTYFIVLEGAGGGIGNGKIRVTSP